MLGEEVQCLHLICLVFSVHHILTENTLHVNVINYWRRGAEFTHRRSEVSEVFSVLCVKCLVFKRKHIARAANDWRVTTYHLHHHQDYNLLLASIYRYWWKNRTHVLLKHTQMFTQTLKNCCILTEKRIHSNMHENVKEEKKHKVK